MDLSRYRKAAVAVLTMVVEIVAAWQGAPEWALTAAAVAGAVLVYAVPNRQAPPPLALPHMTSSELRELAAKAAEREQRT